MKSIGRADAYGLFCNLGQFSRSGSRVDEFLSIAIAWVEPRLERIWSAGRRLIKFNCRLVSRARAFGGNGKYGRVDLGLFLVENLNNVAITRIIQEFEYVTPGRENNAARQLNWCAESEDRQLVELICLGRRAKCHGENCHAEKQVPISLLLSFHPPRIQYLRRRDECFHRESPLTPTIQECGAGASQEW